MPRLFLLCSLLWMTYLGVPANDWPLPHGHLSNGIATSSWQSETFVSAAQPQRWMRQLTPISQPAVANGLVFVVVRKAHLEDPLSFVFDLLALELATGRTAWRLKLAQNYPALITAAAHQVGAPIVDPLTGNILVFSPDLTLTCVSATGVLIWQKATQPILGANIHAQLRAPQLMADDKHIYAVLNTSGWGDHAAQALRVFAFEKKTGAIWWHRQLIGSAAHQMPQQGVHLFSSDNQTQVLIANDEGVLHSLQAQTGNPDWRFELATPAKHVHLATAPGGMLLTSDQGVFLLKPNKRDEVEMPWRRLDLKSYFPAVVTTRHVYLVEQRDRLICLNLQNGQNQWTIDLPKKAAAAPIMAQNHLFLTTQDGSLLMIEDGATRAQIIDHFRPEQPVPSAVFKPILASGTLLYSNSQSIISFGPAELTQTASVASSTRQPLPSPNDEIATAAIHPGLFEFQPGEKQAFSLHGYNAQGSFIRELFGDWQQQQLAGQLNNMGAFEASQTAAAGTLSVQQGTSQATAQIRTLAKHPFIEDFTTYQDGAWPRSWSGSGGPQGSFFVRKVEEQKLLMKLSYRQDRRIQLLFPPVVAQSDLTTTVRYRGNVRDRRYPDIGLLLNGWVVIINHASQQMLLYQVDQPHRKPRIARLPNLINAWVDLSLSVVIQKGSTDVTATASASVRGQASTWQLQANTPQLALNSRPALLYSTFGEVLFHSFHSQLVAAKTTQP